MTGMANPDCLIDGAQTLPEAEFSLPAAFDRVVSANGSRPALFSNNWRLTYEELNATANRLAHDLLARGSARGDRVAVLMHNDAPAIVAILAGLKAGCIVVPINVTHPSARLRQVIEHTDPATIITDVDHHDLARDIVGPSRGIVVFAQDEVDGPADAPAVETAPDDVAILITTSGSTGALKVVMGTHRHLLRNCIVLSEAMAFSAVDRIPLFGAIDGSQSLSVILCALMSGASLHPFPVMVRGVTGLTSWMIEREINTYISSASIFRNFVKTLDRDFKFEAVRALRLASESVTGDDVRLFRRHFTDRCMLVHALASSETGNVAWSRYSYNEAMPDGRLAVGLPSHGHEILIVDEDGQSVVPGEIGEILVRSRYIARGYWGDPDKTAACFSGALDGDGVRQFRTGDLGRINTARLLEFCGRKDSRVKIRGYRIELAHVQGVVQQFPGIEHAIVEAIERPDREPMLVAFVTLSGERTWSHTELRRALRSELPDYMVPSRFVVLDRFPLTPTGKVDRQKLKQGQENWLEGQDVASPSTETEAVLLDIWREIFELEGIDRNADFFELGGDSLSAAVVAARVHAALGVELTLHAFADHPTLSALGAVIDELGRVAKSQRSELTPVSRTGPLVLSSFQERAWMASRTLEGRAGYTHIDRYRLEGKVDVAVLRECMDFLVRRHESLRTTFTARNGRPVQIVHSPQPASFEFIDLTAAVDAQAEANALGQKLAERVIDLSKLPLLHFSLAQVGPDQYWLLRHRHHIISDAWSSKMYFRELARLYSARMRGEALPLPETQMMQYADYAAWQRDRFNPRQPAFRSAAEWWKGIFADRPKATDLPFKLQGRFRRRLGSAMRKFGVVRAPNPTDGIVRWGLERQVSERLKQLSRAERASFYVLHLATFVALLADECKVDDVILGTYVTTRGRLPLQTVYGLFANVVLLRFRCDPNTRFREWLGIVRKRMLEFSANSEIPFDQLRGALQREGLHLPDVHLIFNAVSTRAAVNFPGFRLSWSDQLFQTMPWGFSMNPDSSSENCSCRTLFDSRSYDPVEVRRFVERYRGLLNAVSQNADRSIADLLNINRQ